ncbi:MAG: oligosaccharide flippase family protein, partial [Gammaproteobacteria bacterium]
MQLNTGSTPKQFIHPVDYSSKEMPSIRNRLSQKLRQRDMFTSLALGSVVAFLVQGTGAGTLYLSQILFARWMGPVEYGGYAFAFSWAQLLAALSGLGFTTGVLRFIPQYLSGRDWERLRGVIFRSRQLTFLTGVVIAAIGTLVLLLLQPRTFNTVTLVLGMLLVPLFASLNLHMEMLRGTRHIALAYAPPMLLQPILATGAGFLILRATGTLTSVYTMSVVVMAFLIALVAQVLSLKHVLPKEAAHLPPTYETAEWLRISFPLLLVEGFAIVLKRADILMIGMFIGQEEAG